MSTLFAIMGGYAISCLIGHFVTGPCVNKLWQIAEDDLRRKKKDIKFPLRPPKIISFWHGLVERAVYTSSILLGRPEGIAAWLAFKAIMRFKVIDADPRHVPGSPIYMIGTAMNLAFGVIGGLIATGRTTL